jgi:Tfp pilus assembly protein PilN
MINLLPPVEKRELRAGRTNALLIRYNIALIIALVFLFAAIGVVFVYLNNTKATAETTIEDNKAKVAGFAAVQSQATQFRSNLATAKQILDKEVTYTKVILDIAQMLPQGVVLQNLNLDSATFGTETTLVAQAASYDRALALKASMEKSSLFTNVHFASITAGGTGSYPLTVNMSVTIKKEAAKQ